MPNCHVMTLVQTFPDGAQEWQCPACGRRFILRWPPEYSRVILEAGDETAQHSGSTGGLVMGDVTVDTHDPYLDVYERFMKQLEEKGK